MENVQLIPAEKEKVESQATVPSTVLNLCNNIVGAGILSLPWCMNEASLFPGLGLLLFVGLLSGSSMILLSVCCEYTQCFSFKELGERTLGRKFGILLQASMLIYTSLSCVSFILLTGDFISGESGVARGLCGPEVCALFENRFKATLFITILILLPLSCLKNLNALRYTSMLSFGGMLYLLALLLYNFYRSDEEPMNIKYMTLTSGFFTATPIITVAFTAHYNIPRFYFEMKDRTVTKFALAVFLSLTICGMCYVGVAVSGYLTYGSDVKSDILRNFKSDYKPAILGRLAMSAVVLFTYPLAFNSLRASCFALLQEVFPGDIQDGKLYYGVTLLLVTITFIPGALLDNIAIVLDYKGASLGGCISFAYVAIIFLQLFSPQTLCCSKQKQLSDDYDVIELEDSMLSTSTNSNHELGMKYKRFAWVGKLLIAWTVFSSILGLTITTINVVNGKA